MTVYLAEGTEVSTSTDIYFINMIITSFVPQQGQLRELPNLINIHCQLNHNTNGDRAIISAHKLDIKKRANNFNDLACEHFKEKKIWQTALPY